MSRRTRKIKTKTTNDNAAQDMEYVFEDNLSVSVKESKSDDSKNLQHYFGLLLRDGVQIDRKHKYCSDTYTKEVGI